MHISDTNGTLLFKSKDSRMLRDKEILYAAQGNAVGCLQKKMMSLVRAVTSSALMGLVASKY